MMTRASLGKLTVQCYDCDTVFDSNERECPQCALRTCDSDEHENDALREAIRKARVRASAVGSQHALWDIISDAEALLGGRRTLLDYGEPGIAVRTLTEQLGRV